MNRSCMGCGKTFDTDDLTPEQVEFYGESMCKECWLERSYILAGSE
ncbi:MAG: hypothetical protein ACRD5H_13635 [Nitrososphaerales archaeon]